MVLALHVSGTLCCLVLSAHQMETESCQLVRRVQTMPTRTTDITVVRFNWVVDQTLSVLAAQIPRRTVLVPELATQIGTRLFMRVYLLPKVALDHKDFEKPVLAAAGIETVSTTRLVVGLSNLHA